MLEIRKAISTIDKDQRMKVAIELNVLDQVHAHWNGGKICAQCKSFTQICGRGSGCNGVCKITNDSRYIKPEEKACLRFEREVA